MRTDGSDVRRLAPDPAAEPPKSRLPSIPGLDLPFPGEHPGAGAPSAPEPDADKGETKTVAGPQVRDEGSALDAGVDHAFQGIDLAQLEKDWIEFSK
jgi:hypothetical protein